MEIALTDVGGIRLHDLNGLVSGLQRKIFLQGEVDMEMAQNFIQQLMFFAGEDPEEPVKVFINSPGGSVDAGLVIYDAIQSSPVSLPLYCAGTAYSMGALLFSSGKDGRYILPHSKVMIHEPSISSGAGGKTSSVLALARDMEAVKRELDRILALNTGKKLEEIAEITKTDHFFSAKEAVAFGLADKVMDFRAMLA